MKALFKILVLTFFLTSCEEEKIIHVASQLVDCEGASPQKCMQVKENKEDEWTFFYDAIEGFTHEEGFEYVLKVQISKVKNPPADASSLMYKLIEVVSKEKVNLPNDTINQSILGKWVVNDIIGFKNTTDKWPSFTIQKGKINGSTGCNGFGGKLIVKDSGLFSCGILRMTKMYCDKTAKLEAAFTTALSKATSYSYSNSILKVFDPQKNELFTATVIDKTSEQETTKTEIKPISMRYSATSRGFGSSINLVKDQLIYEEIRPKALKTNKQISATDLQIIYQLVDKINLDNIEKLEPPSKAHQYDGAPGGGFYIIVEGKTYRTPTFDYGNPPAAIKELVEKLVALKSK